MHRKRVLANAVSEASGVEEFPAVAEDVEVGALAVLDDLVVGVVCEAEVVGNQLCNIARAVEDIGVGLADETLLNAPVEGVDALRLRCAAALHARSEEAAAGDPEAGLRERALDWDAFDAGRAAGGAAAAAA